MAKALVKHRFADRAAGLIVESQRLFHLVYDEHYDASDRKMMAQLRKKDFKRFETTDEITVNAAGQRFDVGREGIGVAGEAHWMPECEKLPILADLRNYQACVSFAADHPLTDRLTAFARQREALKVEVHEAFREALGALQQFSTGKRLAEDWPEALPVIGDLIPEDNRTLPVVQVVHLNTKFGLPPSESRAA